jgi:hypothetical protein
MSTDYMPRELTAADKATGNLFHHNDGGTVKVMAQTHTLEVTAPLPTSDLERFDTMVADGFSAERAYEILLAAIARRTDKATYRCTVIETPELPPHTQATFGSTYGNVRKWRTRPKVM